jgi:hypothetical protein
MQVLSSGALTPFTRKQGQLDHDLVGTLYPDPAMARPYNIILTKGVQSATMVLCRVEADPSAPGSPCRAPQTIGTPLVDPGPVYGASTELLQGTRRAPGSYKLRVSTGGFPLVTSKPDDRG